MQGENIVLREYRVGRKSHVEREYRVGRESCARREYLVERESRDPKGS